MSTSTDPSVELQAHLETDFLLPKNETDPQHETYVGTSSSDPIGYQKVGETMTRDSLYKTVAHYLFSPFLDEHASPQVISHGVFNVFVSGVVLGLLLGNKSEFVPENCRWPFYYRYGSTIIGYTYFLCWGVQFYPQVITNLRRQTTHGLSADFCGFNMVGFIMYTTYNCGLYFLPYIQRLYQTLHFTSGSVMAAVPVQSNDVVFAVHGLILTSTTYFQIGYYDGLAAMTPSRPIGCLIATIFVVTVTLAVLIVLGVFPSVLNWLNFLYLLSSIKLMISSTMYLPQIILNYKRKSTTGFAIWFIILDLGGGVFSMIQLVLDCIDESGWAGFTGNLTKFLLGFVCTLYDIIILVQHYVLYPEVEIKPVATVTEDETVANSDDIL